MTNDDGVIDVLVTEDIWGAPFDQLATRWSVLRRPAAYADRDQLAELARHARVLVIRNQTTVDRELLANSPALCAVARAGVGLDNIDLASAADFGVVVTAPLGINAVSVAEHTLGLALALARRTVAVHIDCTEGGWHRRPGRELRGGTWGLLGAGATARACGALANALGMTVLAHDPYVDPAHPDLLAARIELAPLVEVAARADVLSCHLPATAQTAGLIDATLLARMKPTALLINVGRGEILDEDALADALVAGALGGAALDVRKQEPPRLGRLEKLDNIILTPHVAGITEQSQTRVLRALADDIDAVLTGQPTTHAVMSGR